MNYREKLEAKQWGKEFAVPLISIDDAEQILNEAVAVKGRETWLRSILEIIGDFDSYLSTHSKEQFHEKAKARIAEARLELTALAAKKGGG